MAGDKLAEELRAEAKVMDEWVAPLRAALLRRAASELDRLAVEADTKAKAAKAWEGLYNERNKLWRVAEHKLDDVRAILEQNGCDCECDHHHEEHDDDCELCLACQVGSAVMR
jgi:hypothetical protein